MELEALNTVELYLVMNPSFNIIPDLKLGFFIAYNRDPESGRPTNLTNRFTKYFVNYFVGNDSREEIVEPKILVNTNRYAGTYVANLGCFTCPAGSGWPIYDYKINSLGPGKIEFLGGEFVAVKKKCLSVCKKQKSNPVHRKQVGRNTISDLPKQVLYKDWLPRSGQHSSKWMEQISKNQISAIAGRPKSSIGNIRNRIQQKDKV